MTTKRQQSWGVNGATRGSRPEHPHQRGTTRGDQAVPFETRVDVLPGEVLQVLTEKVCDICGTRYHRDRCPAEDTVMHEAFRRYDERRKKSS